MAVRADLRNVAIIAHVDHGKTTLVDAMLWQSGTFRDNQNVNERVMDSMDLEREKGITILAKNTAVTIDGTTINIVDTPGHADFGGEVERALTMVDGVVLLVDAAEGPLPQTRFVLSKALALELPLVLVINKVDRDDARVDEVVDEVYELFLDLDVEDHHIEFPIVYATARAGMASLDPKDPRLMEQSADDEGLGPFIKVLLDTVPAPTYEEDHPFQALVTNLDADPYVGRLAMCRIRHGKIEKGKPVAWSRLDGTIQSARIAEIYITKGLERIPVDSAYAGDLMAVSGLDQITIGETLTDLNDPRPLPPITVDEPSLSMTMGVNTSPLAGQDGKKLTARLIKSRLDAELVGNVSLQVATTERPDTWEIRGRGELQLAILIETMRREGFELNIGKPIVLTREIDGKRHEPMERLVIDVPEEHLGPATQLLAQRKSTLVNMSNHGTGWVRLEHSMPARGLIGFRTEFLTQTRGTGIYHHSFEGYAPWLGEIRSRKTGSLIADRTGSVTQYTLRNLETRGTMFVGPGDTVYEGMVIGESARAEDMDVNATKERKVTNMRSAVAEELVRLTPPKRMLLEESLEFMSADECLEVTPAVVRLRKLKLNQGERARAKKKATAGR